MPCPFSTDRPDRTDRSRRSFMKAAVAIGGTSALAACAERSGDRPVTTDEPTYPQGPSDVSTLPERQHAWTAYQPVNRQNQVVFPQHQVFVCCRYTPASPPTDAQRARVETAFETLERAFQRGAKTAGRAVVIDGLLFSIGYSHSYFDVFDDDLPESAGLLRPEAVLERVGEDPALADDYDAVIHLGSDVAEIVLAAEEALFGGIDQVNGIPVTDTLEDVFEREERRTGLIGEGTPDDKLDVEGLPPKAPLPMGFKSGFEDTLPSEDSVTIQEGPFAGGTTQHISLLLEDLEAWWNDQDHDDRIEKMFSPQFSFEQVGLTGDQLGDFSELDETVAESVPEMVAKHGRVGHSQKLLRARNEDFEPIILRRGDFFETAADETVLNFGSIQRSMEDFVRTLRAMKEIGFEEDDESLSVAADEDGLLDYIETKARATFLVPPRELRALPPVRPDR